MNRKSKNFKEQAGIAIGATIGFVVGLFTGFPLGVIWIAVGVLLGSGIASIMNKHTK